MSSIEWTGSTWNPIVGCRRVSAGCEHCYAERTVHRKMSAQHKGLTVMAKHGPRWNGEYNVAEHRLDEPLRRKKPTTWFVNSLSDLFFEPLPFDLIAAILGVMAACPQHTFQVLTKRPARALEFFAWATDFRSVPGAISPAWDPHLVVTSAAHDRVPGVTPAKGPWPLPNVHLLVSVEDQATADERIPLLLQCPAAVRGVSYEPALGPVDFDEWWLLGAFDHCPIEDATEDPATGERFDADPCEGCPGWGMECGAVRGPSLDWIIVGGESGPGARPFDLAWARSTIAQCEATGVACFVKQLGANPVRREHEPVVSLKHSKGADMSEWGEDLRVREYPEARR